MKKSDFAIRKKFFAALNGYNGFISFFDKIFDPCDYSRIYVLKGGPGTGKNSFMKSIRDRFAEDGCEIEEIYCSSDPSSLDGIIIEKAKKRIAIIDGTAPHESDTRLPGAVDEIIDLGQGWDTRLLVAQRDTVTELNREKRSAYSLAYSYLKIGKYAFDLIKDTYNRAFDYRAAEKSASALLKGTKRAKAPHETVRLISAFGKDGRIRLGTLEAISDTNIKIGGEPTTAMLYNDVIIKCAREKGLSLQISPYPLSNDLCEALFLPDEDISITFDNSNPAINASDFARLSALDREKIKKAEQIISEVEEEAVRWFKIASDLHFRLEAIYSRAMNFENNQKLLEKTIKQIEIILND